MKKVLFMLMTLLFMSVNAYAVERYNALDNRYDITGYVLFDGNKALMEVADQKGNASCFAGDIVSPYNPIEATDFSNDVTLQFETQGDELWVWPVSPTGKLTCGDKPVRFDRIVFKK